jgi:outer membrane protein OmpA-like peptidoglycan-associated protein
MFAFPWPRAVSLTLIAAAFLAGCGEPKSPLASGPGAQVTGLPNGAAAPPPRAPAAVPAASASAGGTAATQRPACSFITRAEMADLLGAPVGSPIEEHSEGTTSCAYPPGAPDTYAQAEIELEWHHDGSPALEQQLSEAFGGSDAGQRVAHAVQLGDHAFYSQEGVLSIRTGKTLITITLPMRPDSESRAVAVGKMLLARLGPPSPAATPASAAPPASGPPPSSGSPSVPQLPVGLSVGEECPIEVANATAEERAALVPLKVGLTLSSIWIVEGQEFECLKQVTAVTDFYVDVTQSCPWGEKHETVTNKRRLCQSDLRTAYFYRTEAAPLKSIPTVTSPTTMFSLSSRSLQELKAKGITRHRYISFAAGWRTRAQPLDSDVDGDLVTKKGERKPASIIINDRPVELPTVVAIANAESTLETTATIVNDERFPLVLDYERPGEKFGIRYTKISYPNDANLEQQLAVDKKVDVYGIYFDFASDRVRPESAPVLAEIAAVLAKNRGWKLNISGHTDNVGSDASNLELSRLRALSVKSALVDRYAIASERLSTGGFGASQPQAKNDTPEGRARNRRVELIRQ